MLRRFTVQLSNSSLRRSTLVATPAFSSSPLSTVARLSSACLRSFSSTATSSSTPQQPANPTADDTETHDDFKPVRKAPPAPSADPLASALQQIQTDVSTHDVFLYMKGNPQQPRCGFSANVVRILNAYPGVKFGSRDVLEDEFVREAIKKFSDWPTLPQLFVKGEFVGGSDIVGNMYKSGELDKILGASPKPSA